MQYENLVLLIRLLCMFSDCLDNSYSATSDAPETTQEGCSLQAWTRCAVCAPAQAIGLHGTKRI